MCVGAVVFKKAAQSNAPWIIDFFGPKFIVAHSITKLVKCLQCVGAVKFSRKVSRIEDHLKDADLGKQNLRK